MDTGQFADVCYFTAELTRQDIEDLSNQDTY